MNHTISWIAAVAESDENTPRSGLPSRREAHGIGKRPLPNLPAHQFPAGASNEREPEATLSSSDESPKDSGRSVGRPQVETPLDRNPEIWAYRKRTIILLGRYVRYSLETGRVPSLLGREFFRATVTSYAVGTFEERVLFAYDVEHCLNRLQEFSRQVLVRIVLQEHGHEESARLLHCSRSNLERGLLEAL